MFFFSTWCYRPIHFALIFCWQHRHVQCCTFWLSLGFFTATAPHRTSWQGFASFTRWFSQHSLRGFQIGGQLELLGRSAGEGEGERDRYYSMNEHGALVYKVRISSPSWESLSQQCWATVAKHWQRKHEDGMTATGPACVLPLFRDQCGHPVNAELPDFS